MISPAEIKALKLNIYKAFLIKVCLVFVMLSITAQISYHYIYQQKLQNLSASAIVNLNTLDSLIHNNLDFMENQVQQFVADTELHRYLITGNELSRDFLINGWQTISERLKWFAKIELVTYSRAGNIRVDYDPLIEQAILSDDVVYQKNNLKALMSASLDNEKLYISKIELNKEYNEPTYPLMPIINIASKIFITDNRQDGIIKVSILAEKLLDPIIQSKKNTATNVLLVDKHGFYIHGENNETEWGNEIQSRSKYNFAKSFPVQWQKMLKQKEGIITIDSHSFIFKPLLLEDDNFNVDYMLIDQISDDYIQEVLYQQTTSLYIFHVVVFFVLTLALWFSHTNKLTKKIQQYSLELVSVLFNSGDAIFIINKHWQLTTVNQVFIELTKYKPADILTEDIHTILNEQSSLFNKDDVEKTIEKEGLWRGKLNLSMKSGLALPCLLSIVPVKDNNQMITHYVSHIIDITEQEAIEAQLKLAAVALETKAGILITDKDGLIQRVNSSFEEITGYSSEEVVGKTPKLLSSEQHSEEFYQGLWRDIDLNGHWEGELWNKRKNGEIYPQWTAITCIKNSNNTVKNYVETFHDITIRKNLEKKLVSMASTDPLTGCLNRRSLEERFEEQVSTAKRYHQTFGLIMFDIDHFKLVNDNYGHDRGDEILIKVVEQTKQTLREADIAARWGGEEFVVILPLNNIDETLLTAERLRNTFMTMDSSPKITCSFGVTNYQVNDSFTEMIKRADTALYKAKESGRNKVILAREQI